MIIGFGNNVVSSLAADITAGQTTIQVMPGAGAIFAGLLSQDYPNSTNTPKTYAKITLTDAKETVFEICHLTAVNNDMLTVVRGQEGTTAKGWSLNDVIANFATRGSENQFIQIEQLQSGHYTSGVAGGTANALTISLPATYFVNGSTDWTLRTPLVIYPSQNNTGASTLQLTMGGKVLGTYKLYKGNKAELVANDILKDVALVCLMDKTKTFFNVANPGAIYAGLGTAAFRDVTTSRYDTTSGHVLQVTDYGLGTTTGLTLLTSIFDIACTAKYAALGVGAGSNATEGMPANSGNTRFSVDVDSIYANQFWVTLRSSNQAYIGQVNTSTKTATWSQIYSTAFKPTAADVGAIPLSGSTAVSGVVRNSAEFQTTSQNSYRTVSGNYGAFWRNDGTAFHLMFTNANDQYGGYGSLRPLSINMASGYPTMSRLNLTDWTYFDARYQRINTASKAANGWYKDTNTGMIFQWGRVGSSTPTNVSFTFPIAFPSACVSVQNTIIRPTNDAGENNWTFVTSISTTGASIGTDRNGAFWFAMGY